MKERLTLITKCFNCHDEVQPSSGHITNEGDLACHQCMMLLFPYDCVEGFDLSDLRF